MVGYVLLVVIAISLSALIYTFLKLYVPKEKPECKDGITIAIQNVECQNGILTATLQNTGRFKINAVYIRIGNASREYREWINDPNDQSVNYEDFYPLNLQLGKGMFPGETKEFGPFAVRNIVRADGDYVIEAQPAIFTGKGTIEELALCNIASQTISCTT